MDEEFVFETVAYLKPSLAEIIQENGGYVLSYQDSITGVFGALVAKEDDHEMAVETVMQILNFYNTLSSQAELPISIHMGVAMGKIVAGKIMSPQGEELRIAGDPIQEARDIAEACPSGRVWVTHYLLLAKL